MQRLVFHIDVNSAFLSWEAMRRVRRGEPDLREIPSAIGGDRDRRTAVILAKSIPAKRFGVQTGEAVAMALRKCPNLTLVPPDFRLYQRCSHAFMDICREYAPVVEEYSIDECFLDMTGTSGLYPDPLEIAHRIRMEIRERLGFTVNVGISENKLLAKMASDFEKPDRVHTLFLRELPQKFWPLPVGSLFTVGAATAQRLQCAGIRTIGDLAGYDLCRLQQLTGEKQGLHLHRYANGIDPSPVLAEAEEAKGYSNSTTLEEDVTDTARAHRILLALADSVAARMRADGARACCIAVTIRDNNFRDRSRQCTVEATDITPEIYRTACALFDRLWDKTTPLRLLSIALTNITRDPTEQLTLFPDERRRKERSIDRTVDTLRSRFGTDMIVRGFSGENRVVVGKKFRAQQENRRQDAAAAASDPEE